MCCVFGTLTINDSLLEQNINTTGGSGSAVFAQNKSVTINNSTIRNNRNVSGIGGAVATNGAAINVFNSTILDNYGGAIAYANATTNIVVVNSTITGNTVADTANNGGAIGYSGQASVSSSGQKITVLNSILTGNGTNDIAVKYNLFSFNMINSIYGAFKFPDASTYTAPVNSVAETDLSQIFEIVKDGKAVATTQTVNGVMHDVFALKKDGIAAQNGALVGKIGSAYYYMDNGKWFALDGTEKADFALDADTGYGLGADATIYSTAQNVDNAKTPVDRLYALKAENAEIIQIGAYAFNFIPNSEAKSLVVNLADDVVNGSDEKTSLREALSYAASLGGTQTITFDSSVFGDGATIVLDSAKGEIELTSNITIDGDVNADGKADVTISGNNATRIFLINSEIAVNLQNLNLINANSVDGHGGAILVNNGKASLTVDNILFDGNDAKGTLKNGGAIYAAGGTLVVSDSVFTNNTASASGGALMSNGGSMTITNTVFDGNFAGYHGGTIYSLAKLYMNGVTVMNSKGNGIYGAALELQNDSVIANSTFINNSSPHNDSLSTTIDIAKGHVQIFGSTFYTDLVPFANLAAQIAVRDTATLDLVNSVVASVSGTEAFKVADTATLNLYGVKYTGTQAAAAGSTLIADADLGKHFTLVGDKVAIATKTVNGVTHSCLMPLDNTGGATVTLSDSGSDSAPDMITIAQDGVSTAVIELVRNDLAADVFTKDQFGRERGTAKTAGSVIYTVEDPSLVVNTTLDVSNAYDGLTSLREAIAYLNQNGTLNGENTITFAESLSGQTITLSSKIGNITKSMTINGDINGNGTADVTVDADQKGYFFDLTTADMEFTINGLILTNSNYTADSDGGAINLKANGITLNVIDSRIENSTNKRHGAVILVAGNNVTVNIEGTEISSNTATWTGAALYTNKSGTTVNVVDSKILNNTIKGTTANKDGGAFAFSGAASATLIIRDSEISGNTGTSTGGNAFRFYNSANGVIEIYNSTFANNKTVNSWGGAITIDGSSNGTTLLIDGSTFSGNSTEKGAGGALHLINVADVKITNTTFENNSAGTNGGAIYYNATVATNLTIDGSRFIGNSAARGGAFISHVTSSTLMSFRNSLFDSNTVTHSGGAILLSANWSGNYHFVDMISLTVINNSAKVCGGGIVVSLRNRVTIANSTIAGNMVYTDTPQGTLVENHTTYGGAGIYLGGIGGFNDTNGQCADLYLLHNIITDNYVVTTGEDGTTTAGVKTSSDFYRGRNRHRNGGTTFSFGNIYGTYSASDTNPGPLTVLKVDGVSYDRSGVTGADLFDASAWDANGKFVVDSYGLVQLKDLSANADLNAAVNLAGYRLGSYTNGAHQDFCFSIDNGKTWYAATGALRAAGASTEYLIDQTGGARVPYSTAGAAQYKPALMWSIADDGTITHWSTIADAKTQLESGSGEYFFAPTMQDFGDVAVNGSLILHGFNPDSELKINLILDSATDAVTVDGMKFTGEATLTAGSMTIENALLTGEGDFAVTNGVLTILNSTVNNFGGTITIDATNGIGQIVNSTLYGNSGTITGNDRLNILNSLVFGTENLSGYTAKYSVFDGTGTAATNTYSASADDVFGTELVWDGLILTALQATPTSTAPHVNGAYTAVNGTNLYYSTDKVNWKNFADDSAATVDDAYIIKTDGLGNTRVVMNGKAVAGAYSALKEAAGLVVTIATDVVDEYDGYISLREAILYGENGEVALNFDSNGDGTMDSYRITFDVAAISGNTEDGYTMRASADGNILIDLMYDKEGYAGALVFSTADKFIIDGENQKVVLDISQGTATRNIYQNAGSLTVRNLALWGTGSNAAGELDLSATTRRLSGASESANGGAIIRQTGGSFLAENVSFERGNVGRGSNHYGGILNPNGDVASSFIVRDSVFRNNYGNDIINIHGGDGRAIRRFEGVTIAENNQMNWVAYHHDIGGAVYQNLIIDGSQHIEGGFRTTYYTANTIKNLTVRNSSFTEDFISVDSEAFYIDGVTAYNNTFAKALYSSSYNRSSIPHHRLGNFTVYNNTFKSNSIFWFAGAGTNFITYDLFNSTIAGNTGTAADLHVINLRPGLAMNLFNSVIVGNKGTSGGYAVYMGDGVTLNAHGNVYDSFFCSETLTSSNGRASTLNGVVLTEAATSLGDSNTLSTVEDVFGTDDLSTVWDGKTLAISKDGAAAYTGVLVGRIGENAYYFVRDGVWHKADGTVYQIDDGTGTMVDVAFTTDAATNYGLGTASGTVVYTTAQNTDPTTGSPDRLLGAEWSVFNVGSHQLGLETGDIVVTNAADYINPFGGGITLREAVELYSKSGDTITFADNVTEIQLKEQILIIHTLTINGAITVNGEDARVHIKSAATDRAFKLNNRLGKDNGNGGISAGDAEYALFDVTLTNLEITGGDITKKGEVRSTEHFLANMGATILAFQTNLTITDSILNGGNGGSGNVLYIDKVNGTSLTFDGVTVNGGTGNSAITAYSAYQSYINSQFLNNSGGSALILGYHSDYVRIENSLFSGNTGATHGGAISGGALMIKDSTFINNTAKQNGGALSVSRVLAENVSFINNAAGNSAATDVKSKGGAIMLGTADSVFVNCTIAGNISYGNNTDAADGYSAGAICFEPGSKGKTLTLINTTVTDNTGVHVGGINMCGNNLVLINSIVAGNHTTGADSIGTDIRSELGSRKDGLPDLGTVTAYNSVSSYVFAGATPGQLDANGNFVLDDSTRALFQLDSNGKVVLQNNGLGKYTTVMADHTLVENMRSKYITLYHDANGVLTGAGYSDTADGAVTMAFGKNTDTASPLTTDQNGTAYAGLYTTVGSVEVAYVEPASTVVTTLDDTEAADNETSLREAIAVAGKDYYAFGKSLKGGATITFSTDVDWNTVGKVITLNSQLSISTAGVVIDGALSYNGTAQGIITIKVPVTYAESLADNTKTVSDFRVFSITANATLNNMILKGGKVGDGGVINTSAYLTMDSVMVSEGAATNRGGGIYSAGSGMYAHKVTIYNNADLTNGYEKGGGGLTLAKNGALNVLVNSTIIGNTSASKHSNGGGSAILVYQGRLMLVSCTVTGNTDTGSGMCAIKQTNTGGREIYILDSIVAGNNSSYDIDLTRTSARVRIANSIYGKVTTSPVNTAFAESKQFTDGTQVFGATPELLTDENGLVYIRPTAEAAGNGGREYVAMTFYSRDWHASMTFGYFDEDGYLCSYDGARLAYSGTMGNNDMTFRTFYTTTDGGETFTMLDSGATVKFANETASTLRFCMLPKANSTYAFSDLRANIQKSLCWITRDGFEVVDPSLGGVGNLLDTSYTKVSTMMKVDGQPATQAYQDLFTNAATYLRGGEPRKAVIGAALPQAEVKTGTVNTDLDVVDVYDGLISLREATGDYTADGDTITFADALTEVKLDSGITISKNLTFSDDNMKISGAALTVADAVSLTISTGSKFEFTEGVVNNGTLANNGTLTIPSLTGTGTLANNGTLSVAGAVAQAGVTNNGAAEIGGNLETTGAVTNGMGAELTVTGTFTAASLDNSGTVTANSAYSVAGTTDNKSGATLKTEGAFNGGAVTNAGNIDANGDFVVTSLVNTSGQVNLAGETITVTDLAASTLGNVTYDGATAQQVITGTYAALILSGAGTKTASGNITANSVKNESETKVTGDLAVSGAVESTKALTVGGAYSATTTTNSSDLKVSGDFAGGAVDNTGSMTLSGATNTADAGSTLGDVTYNGAGDQAIIAGDYGDLTINSTGKATATGDIIAHGNITTSSETEVTGDVFAYGDLESTGDLTVGGDAIALQNMTLSGDTDVTGNLRVHYGDLESTGDLTVGGYVETLYGDVSLSGDTDVTGNLTAAGTLDNDAALTVGGNLTAATTDNSATLDVNGNFAGGTVTNSGSMTLSGATNSGTGTLGDVTYDGTANQQIIAGTYDDLVISSTGTATANGDITATTTTNSATLDVNGNFAGGAVTNTGSMTLAGETNSGTGTLGDVTYDGADQQVIAGTYGDLTINSTGKATATGSISAATVDNNANTEVTGNLTTTGDLESTAALKIGGSVDAANITTTGEMEVAENLTASGMVDNDAGLTVGGNFSAATTDNSSDLTVSGNYTADATTTSGTLDVDGNFSGGAVNNSGSMSLAGASNSATGTLGDVTYNGTTDQEVIAGTYEDLVISTSGTATANGDISAATVKSDAETAITGNLTATGNITSNGDMDVTGDLTATGDLASTAALTVGGDATANNATLSGETTITGDLTAAGTVDNDAALTVGGNLTTDTADNSSDLTVGGNFSATTTNNSGTLDAAGDLNAGALTNSGSISVAGAFATTSTDLGAVEYDGTADQTVVEGTYSDLSLTGGDKSLAGAVTVTDNLTADANIDTAGQDLTISGAVAGSGTISTTTDSGTVTYDGTADQNILAGAYNNLALANGTKTLSSANTTTVNDTFTATGTTIQSDTADVLASLTVKDAGDDNTPSSAIAGTTFNGIALNNTGSADGYLYVNADTNNADDATTGVYLVGNVFVAAEGIIYGDTLGEVYITVTNGNGDVISEGTADDLGWTWAVGNDAIENATTGTTYELVSKAGYKFRFHGDVNVVIGKRAITVKADDLAIDTGDDPVFTYTYIGELVGSDAFTGELASEGDGSQPGDFAITQGTLSLGDNYDLTFIGGTLTVEGGGQDAHQFPNYNNPGNFAGVYDAPVHSTTHSYDHHESVPTLEHQNDRSIGFLFSVSNKQLGDASGAFGDSAPQGSSVNIHAHTLSDLLKSYDKSEQIIASPANEIEDAKDDMKDLHDFSNNPFGILPDDEDLHTRAYDESIDFTVIGEDNLSTAKAEQFKDEFDAALEELLTLA